MTLAASPHSLLGKAEWEHRHTYHASRSERINLGDAAARRRGGESKINHVGIGYESVAKGSALLDSPLNRRALSNALLTQRLDFEDEFDFVGNRTGCIG